MRKKMDSRDLLRLVICSDLRRNLLVCLNEDKKSLGDLRTELNISSTTAIHALRELEKSNLAFQDRDKNYALTKIGRIITLKVADFGNAVGVLKKHERFWLEHDLSGIPEHMMEKIGWLRDSTLLESQATDIFKVHSTYIDMITRAKEITGVSPIFVPEFSSVFMEMIAENKTDIQLVMTEGVMDKIGKKTLEDLSHNKGSRIKIYLLKQDIRVAATVTDYFFSLGFFNPDGTYDWNKDLISYDKEGLKWGRELVQWYLDKAEIVKG